MLQTFATSVRLADDELRRAVSVLKAVFEDLGKCFRAAKQSLSSMSELLENQPKRVAEAVFNRFDCDRCVPCLLLRVCTRSIVHRVCVVMQDDC